MQSFKDIIVLPTEYFCPYNFLSKKTNITEKTYSIHHFSSTWYSENKIKRKVNKFMLPYKAKVKNSIG